ncbi:MAG: hypothetical protein KIS85_07905 [Anaerolineales bacterium]|nr:hypothetical protein [Anaerolineales bacterium]
MRAWGALWVIALLLWLPVEDTHIWFAVALGGLGALWGALRWRPAISASRPARLAWGAGLGAAAPLLALGLMAFKSGVHGHGFPDFTPRQTVQLLQAIPWSAAAGLLIGLLRIPLSKA